MAQLGEGHIRERGRVKVTARGSMQLCPPPRAARPARRPPRYAALQCYAAATLVT